MKLNCCEIKHRKTEAAEIEKGGQGVRERGRKGEVGEKKGEREEGGKEGGGRERGRREREGRGREGAVPVQKIHA